MKKLLLPLAVAAILAAPGIASADAGAAKSNGCMKCHDTDKKKDGPAFKEVAKKYKGDAKGQETMVASILKGSNGKFGPIPMPPNKVTDDEAKKLAAWVLSL